MSRAVDDNGKGKKQNFDTLLNPRDAPSTLGSQMKFKVGVCSS